MPPRLWIERQPSDLPVKTTGTVYEDFTCNDNILGPCSVDPPPGTPDPIPDVGSTFCEGSTYPCDPPEWKAILGNYISTPIFGVARNSKMAGVDNPFTHEYIYDIGCPEKVDCPSDWNVSIQPIGPQRGIAPFTSIVAENTLVELEYEEGTRGMLKCSWIGRRRAICSFGAGGSSTAATVTSVFADLVIHTEASSIPFSCGRR